MYFAFQSIEFGEVNKYSSFVLMQKMYLQNNVFEKISMNNCQNIKCVYKQTISVENMRHFEIFRFLQKLNIVSWEDKL